MNAELTTVTPDGGTESRPIVRLSPRGLYATVDLTGSVHPGRVDVFHVGTGKRATPRRHFAAVGTRKAAAHVADRLDEIDPVAADGTLQISRDEYHQLFAQIVTELTP